MKKFLGPIFFIFFFAFFSGCASVPRATISKDIEAKRFYPKAGNARIYVYRSSIIGLAVAYPVVFDSKIAGSLAVRTYLMWEVAPGLHTISSYTEESNEILKIKAEAGGCYFVKSFLRLGVFYNRVGLERVSAEEGKEHINNCKLLEMNFMEK